uniref:Uncharacterized protein n=1 Tax=Tanacetum cinerariifolium TaxID=118510 RepID=A0A699H1K6_TANCI|nr:hypothetical protein [Tanacetum cinerariifolium]
MSSITAQQTKLDLDLIPKENRLDIRKWNGRIPCGLTLREPTFQVVLDAIALTPCYPAFLITADVPEVYMHQFWNFVYKHDTFYIFKLDKKKRFKHTLEVFKDIFWICPRVPGRDFDALPSEEDIMSFLRELGHTGEINSLNDSSNEESKAYTTYIGYAIGVVPPKISRKFKKASPSNKDSDLVPVDEEPVTKRKRVKRSVKKSLTKPATCIVIRDPPVETKSKRKEKVDVTCAMELNCYLKVDKITPTITSEGTDDKPGFPDVTEDDSTESDSESWGNDEDDKNDDNDSENEGNDEENKSDDDKTPSDSEKDLDFEQDTNGSESDSKSNQQEYEEEVKDDDDEDDDDKSKEIVSLLDVHVHHEVPRIHTSTLLIVPVLVIPEASPVCISIPQSSQTFTSPLLQTTPTPPPTIETTHILSTILDFASVFRFNKRFIALEQDVDELKKNPLHTQVTALVDEYLDTKMGATREEFMNFLSASLTDRITNQVRNQLPQILPEEVSNFAPPVIEKMIEELLNQVNLAKASFQQQSTYDADATLTKFELKKILIDKMNTSESYMTAPEHRECYDDNDKDKGPSARLDQGFKKRKTSKDEEPTIEFEVGDTGTSQGQEGNMGNDDVEPRKESASRHFSSYILNGLQIENLTKEILLGPAFKLLKGTHSNYAKLEYDFEECYKALLEKLDWENSEGDDYPFDLFKPLPLILRGNHPRNRLINPSRDDVADFTIVLRMFTKSLVIQKRVEDLQLVVESYKKQINITKPDTTKPDLKKRHPYTPYKDPQGFIYVDDYKRNMLIRSDELCKFSDGTLTRLLSLLKDITSNIDTEYFLKRRWSTFEKKRAHFMIKDINKLLKERRMMRSFEKLVGGRLYGTDLRLLQRTI